jgi:hypothetical protein
MVISETSYVCLDFSSQPEVLSIQWKVKPDMEQFKNGYWQALQFVKGHRKIRYYSTDISRIGPFDQEQEMWLNWEFYPQVLDCIQADIYAAVIFSEGHFQALVNHYVAPNLLPIHQFIHFNYFTSSAEANDWLHFIKESQDFALSAES